MTREIDLPRLYRGQINLWVEDPLTADYLRELWIGAPVQFLISGGNEGVFSLVKDADENGYPNVFGLVDRDFAETNYADWDNPDKKVRRFVLPVFELENYLLDAEALAQCDINTAKKTPADIKARMSARAGELVWWMACRKVIRQMRDTVLDDFLTHPKCPEITDRTSAEQYIVRSDWYARLPANVARLTEKGAVQAMLIAAHRQYDADLPSGDWVRTFAGKEIFHHVRGYVYHKPVRAASRAVLDADVAKSVAKQQVDAKRIPGELADLLIALKRKANVP